MKISLSSVVSLTLLASTFCVVTSCGYRFGQGVVPSSYQTISVPYVCGDQDGSLTAAIINDFEKSGGLRFRSSGAQLVTKIKLIDLCDENIGFRYDHDKKGRRTKSVVPTETRIRAVVELCVIDVCSQKVILGPVILSSSVDYDHDYYSSRDGINTFSLGQLSDIDEAREAVKTPLYRALARKIVEYINESW